MNERWEVPHTCPVASECLKSVQQVDGYVRFYCLSREEFIDVKVYEPKTNANGASVFPLKEDSFWPSR